VYLPKHDIHTMSVRASVETRSSDINIPQKKDHDVFTMTECRGRSWQMVGGVDRW
jgi:hypothetical protein